jgi:hypothetical protein
MAIAHKVPAASFPAYSVLATRRFGILVLSLFQPHISFRRHGGDDIDKGMFSWHYDGNLDGK